jgi:hypothetical protein
MKTYSSSKTGESFMIRPSGIVRSLRFFLLQLLLASSALLATCNSSFAICATVKIEIKQELTLERQAFDAHMRINNGLSDIPIENVAVTVNFADEAGNPVSASSNPDDTDALFFIRIDTMNAIDNVDGSGIVAPESSADIHWLIIPAPGASNGLESGTLYFVGATLTYTVAGESESIEVSPDYIFVKPMPQLVLDYFLPSAVYGDDAWTESVEAPVPFNLGVRVSNNGFGYAHALKIESAQPEIVANETGLLIGFQIDGSTVNGLPATNSLLADLGDVAPNAAATARWIMSCSLSGRFVEFGAEFSHADELGGKMTSLIGEDAVHTHFLVHDVLVDAVGRDGIEDFLAKDDDVYRIYESDNTTTDVTDQSQDSAIGAAQGNARRLTTPPTAGFMYARVGDPYSGSMLIKDAVRSDGKHIKSRNIWLARTRAGSGPWQYYIDIFDHNTTGSYTVYFQGPEAVAQPPVIMYIPERIRVEGQHLSFLVEATDPNGTTPSLSAERLPNGAAFSDQADGSGIFNWTPGVGQAGRYVIRFVASDGTLESSRQAVIRIFSQDDADGDGMPDNWEMTHFGTLDRDGSGDFDGDGISDLQEYLNGMDPEAGQSVPSVPEILSPENGARVTQPAPDLEVTNSIDPEGDAFGYTFEVFSDNTCETQVAFETHVAPQPETTVWPLPVSLEENHNYYWRVKAADATGTSNWAYGRFFVDTQNDAPSEPGVGFPADAARVDSRTPVLEITNATDPDGDEIAYRFEIYGDSAMTQLITSVADYAAGDNHRTVWPSDTPLQSGQWYYWRAVAVDGQGAETPGPLSSFQVDTSNTAPAAPEISAPADGSEVYHNFVELTVLNAVDPDGDSLVYVFEIDTTPTFGSPAKLTSGQVLPMDAATSWLIEDLTDNQNYYWRVKSNDGGTDSPWTYGRFFVNTLNEPPPVPVLKNPAVGAWVNTLSPQLAVHPVADVDGDAVAYRFEIYGDEAMTEPAGYAETDGPVWNAVPALDDGHWYYWRVQSVDEHGLPGQWSQNGAFFVKINGVNIAPRISFVDPAEALVTNAQGVQIRWADTDPDSNAVVSLYYDSDAGGQDGVLIAGDIEEDPDGAADYFTWDTSTLEGTYYLYAVIDDGASSETVYCASAATIDHMSPRVTADPAEGTFGGPVDVALTADETAEIYYTLDGSQPDFNSSVYTSPLNITATTTITYMAVDTAGNQSAPATQTYTLGATDIALTLGTDKGRTLDGVRVYAFTDAGAYTGKYATTDGIGEAHFNPDDFSDGVYKFRADYLGRQFWSESVNLPQTRSIQMVVPEEPVTVTVATAAGPAAGVRVYLFSASGSYLGQYLTTDADGHVVFNLPAGFDFTFRADLYGSQYWSSAVSVQAGSANTVPVQAGGGRFGVGIAKAPGEPLAGIPVYLFNSAGSYLGHHSDTDAVGRVFFDVPQGTYRVRADYRGYQFWSTDTFVTTDTQIDLTIPHQQVQVSVEGVFQQVGDPLEAIQVYLFSADGAYLGQYEQTDAQGKAYFDLPQKAYKVRADYMGKPYWSDEFTWQDPAVGIPMADVRVTVTGAGAPLQGVRVYLFSDGDTYLGRFADTDAQGRVAFRVPEGSYKFRADYQGGQFWSPLETLAADQLQDVGLSAGGGRFSFGLASGQGDPLGDIECYVFDADGTYLGLQGATDADGQVAFDLADGTYKIRADYLGHSFWSDPIVVPDTLSATRTIDHASVEVSVLTAAGPVPDVRVYLFDSAGAYLGRYLATDSQGRAEFNLPAGLDFMFRADLLNKQYWSDLITVPATGPVSAAIDAGGGRLQLTVQDDAGNALPDLGVYLFGEDGAYLGLRQSTDPTGAAAFDVSAGTYKLRVDYLGYSFWTDAVEVPADTAVTLPLPHYPTTVSVQARFQGMDSPLDSIRVYLFTATGTYLDRYQDTDASGQAFFQLPQRDFTVRVDYLGRQYGSSTFNSQDATVTIPMADAEVTVTGAGLPREGIGVYLFSESGAYLGTTAATDADGRIVFRLPEGTCRFRADYQGNQYWSGPQVLTADQISPVVISVGGGAFTLNVGRDAATPLAGVRCQAFNDSGAYLGLSGSTDAQGQVFYDLADGGFKFRADYLGYQYWSPTVTVPSELATGVQIPHQDIAVTLSGLYLGASEPISGKPLYLFTPAGTYLGIKRTTDDNGRAVFPLPDQAYKVRADYLGGNYWSPVFRGQDAAVQVPLGAVDLQALRDGAGAEGLRVYLFNTAGTYLGRYAVTDADGWTAFLLPEGGYRFRVDADGRQYWSADSQVTADQTSGIEVLLN